MASFQSKKGTKNEGGTPVYGGKYQTLPTDFDDDDGEDTSLVRRAVKAPATEMTEMSEVRRKSSDGSSKYHSKNE
jgi:hypothetical protein